MHESFWIVFPTLFAVCAWMSYRKGAEDWITFVLEPEITGEARLGYEAVHDPESVKPHMGIDESGKGDLFGPLVISAVYTDEKTVEKASENPSKTMSEPFRNRC